MTMLILMSFKSDHINLTESFWILGEVITRVLSICRGPPESPLQVPWPPAPLVQIFESCTHPPYTAKQSALEMTGMFTELMTWLLPMEPPRR